MSTVTQNYIYNTVYNLLSILIPLITTPYIARVLGPEGMGIYSYTYSIASYFAIFIILGLNKYGNRSISAARSKKEDVNKLFCEIYAMQFIVGMLVLAIYVIGLFCFFKDYIWVQVTQIMYVVSSIFDVSWFFFGMEEFKTTVLRNIIIRLINLALIVFCVKNSNGLIVYTTIMAGSTLTSQLCLWPVLLKKYIKLYIPKWKDIIKHLRPNLLLFLPTIAISLYKIMDKIMLGTMSNMTNVGYYENSEKIINIPMLLVSSLVTVMLPRMSNIIAVGDKKNEKRYFDYSMHFVLWLSTAICFGILGISNRFIPFFLGEEFIKCIDLLNVLALTLIFISCGSVISNLILVPHQKDKEYIIIVSCGAGCNLFLNLLLIPRFFAIGAAVATTITEFVVLVCYFICVRKLLNLKKYIIAEAVYLISGIIMWQIVLVFGDNIQNSILCIGIKVFIGVISYCICSILSVRFLGIGMPQE